MDIYAATLAGKNFKTLLVIITKLDLELYQYNKINTFIHTKLNKVIYIRIPPGY